MTLIIYLLCSIFLAALLVSFVLELYLFNRNVKCCHFFICFKDIQKAIFNITLNRDTFSVDVILSDCSSTTEFLAKLGGKCFEIVGVMF